MRLGLEEIVAMHLLALEQSGGADGIRDVAPLESAVAAQTQIVFGTEVYPTVFDKAAAMCRLIIAGHPFLDGNKRTGMLVALTFLKINHVTFRFKAGELEDFAVKIATDHLDVPVIAEWLQAHSTRA